MRRYHLVLQCSILFASILLAGCGAGEGLSVTSIQLGRSLNADSTVAGHTSSFESNDTVYISVLTVGAGSGTIRVRWMYRGHLMGEPTRQVSYRDAAATSFQLKSAGGFPPGEYTVEVFLNDQSVGTRDFRIEKR